MTRQPDAPRGGLGGSAAVMAAGTATSRVLGVVRIGVLVAAVGVNAVPANAFAVANTLPTIVYMLIAGGVLNAVLVPQVVRAYRSVGGQEYVDRLLTVAGALLLAVTVLLTAAAPLIVRVLTGGDDTGLTALATTFAFWCMPQIFFYGVYTLLGQVLNAQGRFGPYMWAPVVNNLVSLAGLVLFIRLFGEFRAGGPAADAAWWDAGRVALLAGTATLGIVAQAAVLAVPLYRSGFRYRPRWRWRDSGLGGAGRVAGWTFAALAAGQVGVLTVVGVANAASTAGRSDVAGYAAYNAAFAMFMLPHSLVTVSLLTALFTRLSVHAAARDEAAVRADASLGLRTIGVFTVLATAVLAVLALPLVRVVVWSSTPAEAASLAPIVVAMLAGLTALGAWSLCQRVFYAYEDARGLFWVQVAMAGVVVAGSVLAAAVLPREWWVASAGASIAASYVVGAVWAGGQLRRRLGGSGALVVRVHVRAGVAAAVAAAVGWPLSRLPGDLSALAPLPAAALCVGVGVVMLALYVVLLRLLDVTELEDLLRPLGARLRRSMGRPVPQSARRPDRTRDDMLAHGGGLLDGVVTPVGPSTLLTGRYRLVETLPSDQPGVDAWLAHDQILDRPVRALVLREGRVAQAQDAARRAALVQDPRLLRVLDVGEHDGVAYTVTEPLPGRDLAELTAGGPLPADQARAIIGEAALALEAARRRGVHHLALRPSAVRVTPHGSVVVSGLAMDGELTGQEATDDASAARADTVDLVGLLYLLLTGRWPAPPAEASAGHQSAAGVLAPAELSPHVPNDLDTLCAVTLGPHDDGPHTPAELVRELEPWRPIAAEAIFGALDARAAWQDRTAGARRAGLPGQDTDRTATGAGDTAEDAPDRAAAREIQRQSVRNLAGQRAVPPRPGTPPPAIPPAVRRADPRVAAAQSARGVGPVVQAAVDPGPTAAMPVTPAPEEADARRPDEGPTLRDAPARHDPARDTSGPDAPPGAPVAATPRPAHTTFDTLIGRSGDALTQRQFDPTPLVLGLVALGVVVGLVTAWNALTAPAPPLLGADTPGAVEEPVAEEPVEPPAADPAAPVEPPAPEAPAAPPVITDAQQIDPPPSGDQNEHPEAVPLAIDGDPATFWYSRTYRSPTYGMKPGIGYGITLAEPAVVSTVTLTVNGEGGMVEVRATDAENPTAGEVLASGPLSPETVLTLNAPTETQNLVLWFPALPQTADGSNRIELAEVAVS